MPLQYLGGRGNPSQEVPELKPLNARTVRCDYFGPKAEKYDEGRDTEEKWNIENEAVRKCLDQIIGGTVVDIPCGTGRFFADYQERQIGAIGFDVSEHMMIQAREKAGNIQVEFGDVMDIEMEDRSVDAAVCVRLLEKFEEHEVFAALSELARVADKYLIFSLIVGPETQRRNRSYVHRMDAFKAMLKEIGFEVAEAFPVRPPEYFIWFCKRSA